jgi:hypothetical protein
MLCGEFSMHLDRKYKSKGLDQYNKNLKCETLLTLAKAYKYFQFLKIHLVEVKVKEKNPAGSGGDRGVQTKID